MCQWLCGKRAGWIGLKVDIEHVDYRTGQAVAGWGDQTYPVTSFPAQPCCFTFLLLLSPNLVA